MYGNVHPFSILLTLIQKWVILAPLEAIRDEDIIKFPVPFISSLFQTIQVLLEFADYFVSTLLITFRLFHVDFMRQVSIQVSCLNIIVFHYHAFSPAIVRIVRRVLGLPQEQKLHHNPLRISVNSLGLLNVLYILLHFLFHPFSPICFLSQFSFRAILSESMFHSALVILFLHPWQYATVLVACQTLLLYMTLVPVLV